MFLYSPDLSTGITNSVPYDVDLKQSNIVGVGRVTDGFDNLGFVPGFHVRGGLNFEYGRARGSVVGIEGGFVAEWYNKEVQLLKLIIRARLPALTQA